MKSTIQLFRHLFESLPPLFPDEERQKMKHALEHLEKDPTVPLADLEEMMIGFGYSVWPWNKAYQEFLALAEGEMGEHFFLPKLSGVVREKFLEFKLYGGSLRELHSGRPADYFSLDDRTELCAALIDTQKDLRQFVDRKIISVEKKRYLEKVAEFQDILENIKNKLREMLVLAEEEQDHPNLAGEIRARVRAFEEGLCNLAPSPDHEAVCQSVDFFHGRKTDLNGLRGSHLIPEVDFYSE